MKKILLAAALLTAGIVLVGYSFDEDPLDAGVAFGLILVSIATALFWLFRVIRKVLIQYTTGE